MACAEFGYTDGFLLVAEDDLLSRVTVLPPWVGSANCGSSETLQDCLATQFGETDACGRIMALFCSTDFTSAPLAHTSQIGLLALCMRAAAVQQGLVIQPSYISCGCTTAIGSDREASTSGTSERLRITAVMRPAC